MLTQWSEEGGFGNALRSQTWRYKKVNSSPETVRQAILENQRMI